MSRDEFLHPDAHRVVFALRDAMPTRFHAEAMFEQAVEAMGGAGWVETRGGGKERRLFRRDAARPELIVPWPVLVLRLVGRPPPFPLGGNLGEASPFSFETPEVPEPPERTGEPPRITGLDPGEIEVYDGPEYVIVSYKDDGRWFETTRSESKDSLASALEALGSESAHPIELLSGFVASLDPGRHGPGRVLLPAPFPDGVEALWERGRGSLQGALFSDRVPADAAWLAADSLTGEAIAWGATPEDALASWRAAVERTRPWPARPEAPPRDLAEDEAEEQGLLQIRSLNPDVPMPARAPENTPGVLVPLEPLPPPVCELRRHRLVDRATGRPVEATRSMLSITTEFHPRALDIEDLQWGAVRLKWLKA
jgi:hypothetical protein